MSSRTTAYGLTLRAHPIASCERISFEAKYRHLRRGDERQAMAAG
jgi:hypothetical protein